MKACVNKWPKRLVQSSTVLANYFINKRQLELRYSIVDRSLPAANQANNNISWAIWFDLISFSDKYIFLSTVILIVEIVNIKDVLLKYKFEKRIKKKKFNRPCPLRHSFSHLYIQYMHITKCIC